MNKTQLVEGYIRRYCDNNNQLTIPKQTLSRLIYNENHGLFSGIDAVRNIVRSLTGSNKTNTKALPGFSQPSTIEDGLRKYKLFTKLPEPKEKILKPGAWLVMSDIHFPEHDPTAIAASLNFAKNARVDGIVLNGDIIDMYEVSRFIKEVGRPSIKTELAMTRSN